MDTTEQLLRIENVAERLNLSQKSVRRYIHAGKLKSNKIGGVHRVAESELQYFLNLSIYENGKLNEIEITYPKSKKTDLINWIDISEDWDGTTPNEFTSADLFCGAGGMAKGFEMAGFNQVCGLDWFKEAGMTYRENFSHPLIEGDITQREIKDKFINTVKEKLNGKNLTVLSGGFPCQGFSMSGNRIVEDKRNSLYKDMLEIIDELQPEFIDNIRKVQAEVLENYSKIVKPGGKLVYATCSILPSENQEQVQRFLTTEIGKQFQFVEDRKILASESGFDGFYMALLERKNA